jgi:spore germination protein PC
MYTGNWQYFFQCVNETFQKQNQKIYELQKQINELKEQLNSIQTTNIEKIEYHFDQLKIETLEGTLNIGLSPQGITAEDEMAIPNLTNSPDPSKNALHQTLQQELHPFIYNELPLKIKEFASKYEKSFPPGYENMMLQDIYRQLPGRIQHYITLHSENNNGLLNDSTRNTIIQDIKKEIIHSLKKYIEGYKGGK